MSERDSFTAGHEARRDVSGDPSWPTRHEQVLLRYLGGAQYAETRVREHARVGGGRMPGTALAGSAGEAPGHAAQATAEEPHERLVVVGVDESPSSYVALDHAAVEAELRGWPLRVVHVQHPVGAASADRERSRGAELLQETADRVRYRAPLIAVTSELLVGSAAGLLVLRSAAAGLVVVGSRGRGGFMGLLAGSVSTQVATHAHGPVLIVRVPTWPPSPGWPSLPVVVGVDGSAYGRAALRFAVGEAQLRGVPLLVVHAPPAPGPEGDGPDLVLKAAVEEAGRTPDLPVRGRTVPGDARQALIEASRRAAAVVVGQRGQGGFAGLRMGSVSQAVIRHAHCPVFVVHEPGSRSVSAGLQ
ncbi:MAG TPA: universal stress protein [Micromonosporaceae bacterium]|nr:universal stress protein [Micromonosporaceae bacterium]